MPKKRYAGITIADLLQWQATAVREQPESPSQETCIAAPQLLSFTPMVRGYRIVIAGKLDNGETIIWDMNPLIAQNLALNILALGRQMQWLDEDNQIRTAAAEQ